MSRIEKAIEIAARQRHATAEVAVAQAATPSAPAIPAVGPDAAPAAVPAPPADRSRARTLQPLPLPATANPCLVMANAIDSPAAEQYRKLKSNLMKLIRMGKGKQSLMVTSPMAGDGKTVTALNLAISLAQEYDHTVLLVEADLRKPSLLQYLGLEAERGLSDCVLDGVDVGEVLIKTGIGNLSILPAGRPVDNPVELFSSKRMQELITEVNNRYPDRFVIVDTTPLLPFAEPQYLAGIVDGVILVVRENVTPMDKLTRALEMLKNHNLLGVVSNGVSRAASLSGYYGYYGYYSYGYKKKK